MTDVNYNTGFATAVGFGVAFVCAMAQMAFKRTVNRAGVIDSNSAIFQFLIPSFFAAINASSSVCCGQSRIAPA